MKKTITMILLLVLIAVFAFAGNTYAASLDTLKVETSKTTIRPGEEVKVTMDFGKSLGAYTFEVSYDKNIFEYQSVDGGSANNTGDKVKVTFYDATGGSNPRTNMSVIFKAKEDITTSNPTEFTVTAEGLANADATETYDDITSPIVKNVTVEPQYIDYTLKLEYAGDIIKEKEKDMVLSYSSPMGHYYEHARLVAQAKVPTGATVTLIGKDELNAEHDIIQSGWGDAQGYKIGGKDVSQTLNVKALFSDVGDYTITLKLIDRDNSDHVIAQKDFTFKAINEGEIVENPDTTQPDQTENNNPTPEEEKKQETPTRLPKTGNNSYLAMGIILIGTISLAIMYNKRK